MKYKQIWKTAAACLMAAVMLPGCSDEEGGGTVTPEDGYATLAISFYSVNSSEPVGTRAPGDPENTVEEENDYERRIEHWWVLIYNDEGFVDYLSDAKGSTATTPTGDDSRFSTSIELPIGTYRLYGFANLGSLDNESAFIASLEGGSIDEDDLVADRNTLAGQAVDLGNVLERFNVNSDTRPTIPMSAYVEEVTLSEDGQNSVELGLYRMIGKVRVEITNQTGDIIDLDALSMKNFRTAGDIFLMPYDGLDKVGENITMTDAMQPIFPADASGTYASYSYPVGSDEQITDGTMKSYSFYVPETPQEGQENGSSPMIISFNVEQKGGLAERETNFDFVRRNDLLIIPVTISNIDSKISYNTQDTPIGGLPNVVWQTEDGISIDEPIYVVAPRDDAGPVEIQYEFETIANYDVEDIHIRYKASNENTGLAYSEAQIVSNVEDGNDYGLLIDPEDMTVLPNDTEITLVPDGETTTSDNNTETIGGAKGKILVYTQELASNATATIRLKLVAICTNEDQTTTEVEIPYTIVVQNYSSTTTN